MHRRSRRLSSARLTMRRSQTNLATEKTDSSSAVRVNSFPGFDSIGVRVRVKFRIIVFVQIGSKT